MDRKVFCVYIFKWDYLGVYDMEKRNEDGQSKSKRKRLTLREKDCIFNGNRIEKVRKKRRPKT